MKDLLPVLVLGWLACAEPAAPDVESPVSSSTAVPTAAAKPTSSAAPSDTIEVSQAIRDVVAAADRTEDDRALDAGRHPAEMLAFFGVEPGMRVAELQAGRGYTAELLARAVGPTGAVYGQNNKFVLEKFAEQAWSERLQKPVNAKVVRVDRELESPIPPDVRDLDVVFLVLFYHDSVWMETDRTKMNTAIFESLKPGGLYAVIDHNAADGAGLAHVKTLHRIEEKTLRAEIESVGFRLARQASFLRNPEDTRDWSASPSQAGERRGESDRFVHAYVKPK